MRETLGRSPLHQVRPECPNRVWSYDFVEDCAHNGRKFRMLNVIDEFTRECTAIWIDRKPRSTDVIDVLSDLFRPSRRVRACGQALYLTVADRLWAGEATDGREPV